MTAETDLNYAKYLAQTHNMFISIHNEKGRTAYVLYRRAEPANVRIARRSSAHDILALVKDTIGQPA